MILGSQHMPPRKVFLPRCVYQDPWDPSDKNSAQTKGSRKVNIWAESLEFHFGLFKRGSPLLFLNGFLQLVARGECKCFVLASESVPDLGPDAYSLILNLPLPPPGLCTCCVLHLGRFSPRFFASSSLSQSGCSSLVTSPDRPITSTPT